MEIVKECTDMNETVNAPYPNWSWF